MKDINDKTLFINQFYKLIYVDFGIAELNDKIKNWYQLTWEEFKEELVKLRVKTNSPMLHDWEHFFYHHKNKVNKVSNK